MADDASFDSSPDVLNSAAQGRLRTVIERLERLELAVAEATRPERRQGTCGLLRGHHALDAVVEGIREVPQET